MKSQTEGKKKHIHKYKLVKMDEANNVILFCEKCGNTITRYGGY
jgi:5-methylcytosine-specific restriction endonuclease McrA